MESGRGREAVSVATLERRLSGVCWRYRQMGEALDVSDPHIATVLAGIRRAHGRPPAQKEAIFADDLLAMLATLENDLRGLRDKAILAIGFAGGLRRSEIVGLDCGPDQSEDGTGWIDIFAAGVDGSSAGKKPVAKAPEAAKDDPEETGASMEGDSEVSTATNEGGPIADDQWQDRLARGRDRPRLLSSHLPRRHARDLDAARPHQSWPAVPPRRQEKRGR